MAVSKGERLRKAAAKANKRKAVLATKRAEQRRQQQLTSPREIDFASAPIAACTLTPEFESSGERTLFLARRLSPGRYATCFFDLDLWCFGVDDAFFELMNAEQFDYYLEGEEIELEPEPIDPADARKLLADAAAFGAANGFPPPESFAEMELMFGDVAPSQAEFELGDGGLPHLVVYPADPPARVQLTIKQLERSLGPKGFRVTRIEDEREVGNDVR